MPPMTWLGWFHTVMGAVAILVAIYSLAQHRIICAANASGRAYLLITLVVAGSALMIYNQGGFGVGHILAVMTLLALLVGYVVEKRQLLGRLSIYVQTAAYSATVLFHMIPAITDFLRRLPVDEPFAASLDAPLVVGFQLSFLVLFALGLVAQWIWLARTRAS